MNKLTETSFAHKLHSLMGIFLSWISAFFSLAASTLEGFTSQSFITFSLYFLFVTVGLFLHAREKTSFLLIIAELAALGMFIYIVFGLAKQMSL